MYKVIRAYGEQQLQDYLNEHHKQWDVIEIFLRRQEVPMSKTIQEYFTVVLCEKQ